MLILKGVVIGLIVLVSIAVWQGMTETDTFTIHADRLLRVAFGMALGAVVPPLAVFVILKSVLSR